MAGLWGTLRKILRAHDTFPRANLERVKAPSIRRPEAKFLTATQYDALCVAADAMAARRPLVAALVRVWVEACCRPQELLGLRWEDYAGGVVKIRRAICAETNGVKELKTERNARDVPLSPDARRALDAWRTTSGGQGPIFTRRPDKYWNYQSLTRWAWQPLAKAAGLAGHTPYCMRHTGPSLLLADGGSIIAVARRMGHTNATLVLKTYGHTMPDDQGRLTAIFAAKRPELPTGLPTAEQ